MATIYIDDKPYEVNPENNLLHECLSLGFNIPYFCWHPFMGSVGACRQCAVKQFRDESDKKGKIIMACMTPAADGTRISIDDPEARAFRASVIEWLMLSHPHDCPICDEGGECHLQDMTVMTGHAYRRTRFRKRTHRNQNLGPFINHEMNRCIQCYRCVRYYRDYAGGNDLDVFGIHNHVYFGRSEEGVLESPFSGNLVEVCPTGVFTDKTLGRHYTRKWDMEDAPSICVHCGLGCNTSPRARYGMLRRIVNRYNLEINGHFICDRGRFGYEFVNSSKRIRRIRIDKGTPAEPVSKRKVIDDLGSLVKNGGRVIGIGSPRASLESNFALRKLVGEEHFHLGMRPAEQSLALKSIEILRRTPAHIASIRDVETSDAVLVLGEDLINTAPRLALAVRQSVRQKPMEIPRRLKIPVWNEYAVKNAVQDVRGPLIIATPYRSEVDGIASASYRGAPEEIARLGYAIADALHPGMGRVQDLSDEMKQLASRAAQQLREADCPAVISGPHSGSAAVIDAAASVAAALVAAGKDREKVRLCLTAPECNSSGLAMLGGAGLNEAFEKAKQGLDAIIVLENDLYRRAPSQQVDDLFTKARIVLIDSLENETATKAHIVLPAATFAESEGTLINNEGRAQRFFKVMPPAGETQESWRLLRDVLIAAGRLPEASWMNLDAVLSEIEKDLPQFGRISAAAPSASFRIAAQKIPRQLHRYSGRTAMYANVTVHEPAPPADNDSALAFSMEGYQGRPPAGLASFFWNPGWNSYQAVNKYQEGIGGPLRGGPAGVRLLEEKGDGTAGFNREVPDSFRRRAGELLVIPSYRVFGSEELSIHAPGIAERAGKPFMEINSSDAGDLGISAGQELELLLGSVNCKFSVRLNSSLPPGVAALPVGMPGLAGIELPVWARITPPNPLAVKP